jgi:Raf kinase inhibitor-like YbhB/YbcL family protein
MSFRLFSPSFTESSPILRKHSCHGADISPVLHWDGSPVGTKSFALIMNDPDAPSGDWVHWILYNIPPQIHELPEGFPGEPTSVDGILQGQNSWHQVKYGGPCPPGGTHHYYFRLYALDSMLSISPGVDKHELQQNMKGHILEEAVLMGTFTK